VTRQAARPALVLASGSPARRALLEAAGLAFEVIPAELDEVSIREQSRGAGRDADETALILASAKAEAVASLRPEAVVIGADQILACQGAWLEKPGDLVAAREQLRRLRGREHTLETGAVIMRGREVLLWHLARPRLKMRAFSDRFLDAYLEAEGAAVLGAVGSYRLEGPGLQLFSAVEGDHSAILGLPMLPVLAALRKAGVLIA
jgi:septum formation protein